MILFHTPGSNMVDVGMVLCAYRGVKVPKLHVGDLRLDACSGLRVVALEMQGEDPELWRVHSTCSAYVVRLEALICILQVEKSGAVAKVSAFCCTCHWWFLFVGSCVVLCLSKPDHKTA